MRRWLWIILAAELLLLGVAEKCAFEPALAPGVFHFLGV